MKGFDIKINTPLSARAVTVEGRIQGVGFRPFLYRLAKRLELTGWVKNCTEGVRIYIEGPENKVHLFINGITSDAPAAAKVHSVHVSPAVPEFQPRFSILPSESEETDAAISEVPPDIAVCKECLSDMNSQGSRFNYFFTNCTNCGPRFTIIKALPYDRESTTMAPFTMCGNCLGEYREVTDRRFHAQPVSCLKCGPSYTFQSKDETITNDGLILQKIKEIIRNSGICAIKGLGGYHLVCDPFNTEAVERLRKVKKREGKPFAVMFPTVKEIRNHVQVSETEEKALTSSAAPIVLLKLRETAAVSPAVYRNLPSLGCILPYTPFYHALFSITGLKALVLTSGNISHQPLVTDNKEALSLFLESTDGVVTYDREIHNRCDDSVGRVSANMFRLIRRSRGWVPESLLLKDNAEGILAVGAELKTCFCIGKNYRAVLSQHIGDLKNPETVETFTSTVERFKQLFRFSPSLVVHDLHPDYASTRFARSLGLPVLEVQHHHAHIASCLTENKKDETVIGFSYDGTGLGDDGNIWGGEVLLCDLEGYQRAYHLPYLPMPGGDAAVAEPWRMALSVLYRTYGKNLLQLPLPFLKVLEQNKIDIILKMIERKINTPLTSSMGRLFDAVSALLGLCTKTSFDAEAPMRLEAVLKQGVTTFYPVPVTKTIDTSHLIKGIVDDILQRISPGEISAKFHNSIIHMTGTIAELVRNRTGVSLCALSGGVFMNTYLLEGCTKILEQKGFSVLSHAEIPCNDGGLALGQLAIGAKKRKKGAASCV